MAYSNKKTAKYKNKEEFILTKDKQGNINIQVNEFSLHSSYTARKEAERLASKILNLVLKKNVQLVIIGIAWGYIIEEIHKLAKLKEKNTSRLDNLYFWEPIAEVCQLLNKHDRFKELKNRHSKLYSSMQELIKELVQTTQENSQKYPKIEFFVFPNYNRLFASEMQKILRKLQDAIQQEEVDQTTQFKFVRQWTRNAFKRINQDNKKLYFFEHLEQEILDSEENFVYCGAGPHLLSEIQNLPEKPFIIASDSAAGALIHSKIAIDILISVDSGRSTLYHITAMQEAQRYKNLLASPQNSLKAFSKKTTRENPSPPHLLTWTGSLDIIEKFFEDVYYYHSTLPFDQLLSQKIVSTQKKNYSSPLSDYKEWINPSRNPLGLALHLARLFKKKKLFLAGTPFSQF